MLNEVQIEGVVTRKPWKYDKDLFFRIGSYRDADMPAKPDLIPGRDEPDYINVRVPGGATSLMNTAPGEHVRIHGYLQSRDIKESLTEFLRKAGKNGDPVPAIEEADKIKIDRGITELVALRVVLLSKPETESMRSPGKPPTRKPASK